MVLAQWIANGRNDPENHKRRLVRSWELEARGHFPIIDRVKYPETGRDRRAVARVNV